MKIKLLALLAVLLSSVSMSAFASGLDLLISRTDGTSVRYSLDQLPQLSFKDGKLQVSCYGDVVEYLRDDISSLVYINGDTPSGVDEVETALSVHFFDHSLTVTSPTAETAWVYAFNGSVVATHSVPSGETLHIDYAPFPSGGYILKIGTHSYKFLVR